ncbi:DUF7146 domain-containing protein [Pseudorhodoplanes sp.]|uniref:DUF7146 domain-containing protein n=1 Tax=Pseudorhodoplanes sp. TaxID=1934341 RepID=UPI003D0CF6C1
MGAFKKLQLELQLQRERPQVEGLEAIAEIVGGTVDGVFVRIQTDKIDAAVKFDLSNVADFFIYAVNAGTRRQVQAYIRSRLKDAELDLDAQDAQRREKNAERAQQIWNEALPATGTLVESYLRHRGIIIPIPDALRFHPKVWNQEKKERYPAMIAYRTGPNGGFGGIHRTWLSGNGRDKLHVHAPRKDLASIVGSTIRLAPVSEELAVGEGIETALSCPQLCDGLPAWAAGSAYTLEHAVLPPEVRKVSLLEDQDIDGMYACREARFRFNQEGRAVRIIRPSIGNDLNDEVMSHGR